MKNEEDSRKNSLSHRCFHFSPFLDLGHFEDFLYVFGISFKTNDVLEVTVDWFLKIDHSLMVQRLLESKTMLLGGSVIRFFKFL